MVLFVRVNEIVLPSHNKQDRNSSFFFCENGEIELLFSEFGLLELGHIQNDLLLIQSVKLLLS